MTEESVKFRPCEHCGHERSLLKAVFPNEQGFPYLLLCSVCVSDLSIVVDQLKETCDAGEKPQDIDDDDWYVWSGKIVDGAHNVLWTEADGQLYAPTLTQPNS